MSALRLGEGSPLVGGTLAEVGLRTRFGVTLLAIRRDRGILSNPEAATRLLAGDILIVLGPPSRLAELAGLIHPPGSDAGG